jgi:hypothetical protein
MVEPFASVEQCRDRVSKGHFAWGRSGETLTQSVRAPQREQVRVHDLGVGDICCLHCEPDGSSVPTGVNDGIRARRNNDDSSLGGSGNDQLGPASERSSDWIDQRHCIWSKYRPTSGIPEGVSGRNRMSSHALVVGHILVFEARPRRLTVAADIPDGGNGAREHLRPALCRYSKAINIATSCQWRRSGLCDNNHAWRRVRAFGIFVKLACWLYHMQRHCVGVRHISEMSGWPWKGRIASCDPNGWFVDDKHLGCMVSYIWSPQWLDNDEPGGKWSCERDSSWEEPWNGPVFRYHPSWPQ